MSSQLIFGHQVVPESGAHTEVDAFSGLLVLECSTVISAAFLLLRYASKSRTLQKLCRLEMPLNDPTNEPLPDPSPSSKTLSPVYDFWRLLGCATLAGISVADLVFFSSKYELQRIQLILCLFYAYCTLLALVLVRATPETRHLVQKHLNVLLVVAFGVYAYRDVWPLATFDRTPLDPNNWTTWSQVGVLGFIGVLLPLLIPHEYIPVDTCNPCSQVNPEQTASYLSFMLFSFLDPLVFHAARVPHLPYEALPPLADYDQAAHLKKRSFPWMDPTIVRQSGGRLLSGILHVFRYEILQLIFWMFVKAIAVFIAPIAIYELLSYIETHGEEHTVKPWVWIAGLFLGPVIASVAMQIYIFIDTANAVRGEAVLTQLVFEHALRIRLTADTTKAASEDESTPPIDDRASSSGHDSATETLDITADPSTQTTTAGSPSNHDENLAGKLHNLITSDMENIVEGRDALLVFIFCPLQILVCVWFLYGILSYASIAGTAVMFLTFPIPSYVIKLLHKVQEDGMKKTDARLQEVTETINVLRMIKLFAWERRMKNRIAEKREQELGFIRKRQFLNLANINLNFLLPLLTMIATFGFYTVIMNEKLTASRVFSAIAMFDILREQIREAIYLIQVLIQAKVSLDRMDTFLHESVEAPPLILPGQMGDDFRIGFHNAVFSWYSKSAASTPGRRNFTLQLDGDLFFWKGKLNIIVGPTGCGKTSLLMALLSEMHFQPFAPDAWFSLPREGGVAYCAQESWVQNDTIKNNILFGSPYEEERYQKVIYQCALERDLAQFDAGDETEVGEKGLTLRQARWAEGTSNSRPRIYSRAEILLLDDILAALDVHTGRWIVEKLFKGDLVGDRTIIMITHNVAMMAPIADYIVSMGLNGRILSQGVASEVLHMDIALIPEVKAAELIDVSTGINTGPEGKMEVKTDGKLTVAEEVALGRVSWSALGLFLGSLGGPFFWLIFLGGMFLADLLTVIETYWLGYWARQYEGLDNVSVSYYLGVYGCLILIGMLIYSGASFVYVHGTIHASRSIHAQLTEAVLGTPLRWLDTTPMGRIINRFSIDIRAVDGPLTGMLAGLTEMTMSIILKFGAVVSFSPVFAVPGAIVAAFGGWLGRVYIRAQLAVKREMSNAKAPILSYFNATTAGLVSIRAYGAQDDFKEEFLRRTDHFTRPARTFYNLNRWISLRIDALGALFSAALAAWLVYGPGSAKCQCQRYRIFPQYGRYILQRHSMVGQDIERVRSTSLERLESYIAAPQEQKASVGGQPPAAWPTSGAIRVEGLSASYSPGGPKVLHDISFELQSGERVGIVGRTGSGKSSLTLSLLRLIPSTGDTGAVYYDGIATNMINLDALRSNITVIPQQPELLSGTLRQNLDPFGDHDDATLYAALQSSGLHHVRIEGDDGYIGLDTVVAAGGSNFSLGQRQIISIARAIARSSKVMILDEATAGVDYETDAVIQRSIRTELHGVTLIIVAHRLSTIMDADRVMVLDAGKVMEFGRPWDLLQGDALGMFKSLVDQSGSRDQLVEIARRTAEGQSSDGDAR